MIGGIPMTNVTHQNHHLLAWQNTTSKLGHQVDLHGQVLVNFTQGHLHDH